MRHGSESQTNQGEVLYDCYHVTSALGTLRSESHVITKSYQMQRRIFFAIYLPTSTIKLFHLQYLKM